MSERNRVWQTARPCVGGLPVVQPQGVNRNGVASPPQDTAPLQLAIRPILPHEDDVQRRFFDGLSPRSRFGRFMRPISEMPDYLMTLLASVDNRRHVAFMAEATVGRRRLMVGEARFVITSDRPDEGEFAITVADAWQGRGIAGSMLSCLEARAHAAGVRHMVADTLSGNGPMLGLALRFGYAVGFNCGDPELKRLHKDLSRSVRRPRLMH